MEINGVYTLEELDSMERSYNLVEKHMNERIMELEAQDNKEDAHHLKNALTDLNLLLLRLHEERQHKSAQYQSEQYR